MSLSTAARRVALSSSRRGVQPSVRRASTHHESAEEGFSTSFYIGLTILPISYVIYKFSQSEKNPITQLLDKYTESAESISERADLHVKYLEKAAADRNLLYNSKSSKVIDLRFPEQFANVSPWNVPAGSHPDLSEVVDRYRKQAKDEEEKHAKDQ